MSEWLDSFGHDEFVARQGLNVSGYEFKWKEAKRLAEHDDLISANHRALPFWERVRLLFLELGGEYVDVCVCGDYGTQHDDKGCRICRNSPAPYDGCMKYRRAVHQGR